ncbi:mRNA 3'-end-processing protein yth1 [Microthyrium microscopicum]|uniref:mRNA 3'-end-processing protein n=1 Tax=Microthyrium microscopicum TaxID=703497 RepID=A0A6A6US40_9PEZI|nr:mRNA 3'-end-processing protein yth1 [Microthyrium microscopicum]
MAIVSQNQVQAAAVDQILHPSTSQTPQYDFNFSNFLKREYRYGIDIDRPICKAFVQGHCPAGSSCPDRHPAQTGFNSLVCKHWMRALCKKGEGCEFLHEYNLRRMPECHSYADDSKCPNGDDCMYQHIDKSRKRPPCPHYDRGFCPLGPLCANKHVKKAKLCQLYLAGFCPNGRECQLGAHARFAFDLKKPVVKGQEPPEEAKAETHADQEQKYDDDGRFSKDDRQFGGGQQKFGRGGWQGKKRGRGGFKPRGRG